MFVLTTIWSPQEHSKKVVYVRLLFDEYLDWLVQVGEVGELSEIFQWKGEVAKGLPNWSSDDKEHLEEEISDVLLYLVRLADVCGLDLGQAALTKIVKNAKKYPVMNHN